MSTTCSITGCANDATTACRLLPYRTDEPVTPEIRRALDGLGGPAPVTVRVCSSTVHRALVRRAGAPLSATSLVAGADVRKVKE
jgi:hypothetical protein